MDFEVMPMLMSTIIFYDKKSHGWDLTVSDLFFRLL